MQSSINKFAAYLVTGWQRCKAPLCAQNGQSLVEAALVFVCILPLLGAMVEYGRVTYFWIEMTNAANAGASYAAQSTAIANGTTGGVSASSSILVAADVANLQTVVNQEAPYISLTLAHDAKPPITVTATMSSVCSDGVAVASCGVGADTGHLESVVKVTTSAVVNSLFNIPNTFTLTGAASMWVR